MTNPAHTKLAKCRSCGAYIVWLKTQRGANMPTDADSVNEGDTEFDPKEYVSHFSTCPDADQHRRRK